MLQHVCYTHYWANSLIDCQRYTAETIGFYPIEPTEMSGETPKQPQLGDDK